MHGISSTFFVPTLPLGATKYLKKLLTQKGDYSNSDTAKDYLRERYKTRPVPPIFKPLYDRYVARKEVRRKTLLPHNAHGIYLYDYASEV